VFDDQQPVTGLPRIEFSGLQLMQNLTVNTKTSNLYCFGPSYSSNSLYVQFSMMPLHWIVCLRCCTTCRSREPCPPLYSPGAVFLIGYNVGVLVGLQGSNTTRITYREPSQTRSSPFLAGYPGTISHSQVRGSSRTTAQHRSRHMSTGVDLLLVARGVVTT
jgi:hypothetical protein